jgi:hypothetical protein
MMLEYTAPDMEIRKTVLTTSIIGLETLRIKTVRQVFTKILNMETCLGG